MNQTPLLKSPLKRTVVRRLTEGLGELAHYWLNDKARALLAEQPEYAKAMTELPPLPTPPGSCWIIFVVPDEYRHCLRDAVLMPLRWVRGTAHDPRLPTDVIKVANRIRDALKKSVANSLEWVLRFGVEPGPTEPGQKSFSKLDPEFDQFLTADSGAASLAAGLLVATFDAHCRWNIWATGDWRAAEDDAPDDGISAIKSLEAKIQLAHEWGAAKLFVPESNQREAEKLLEKLAPRRDPPLKLGVLKTGVSDPREGLAEYEYELAIPPQRRGDETNEKALERLGQYFLGRPTDGRPSNIWRIRADDYYRSALLPMIADRLREQLCREHKQLATGALLVSIFSGSPDLVRLTALAVRPARVLVLYTDDKSPGGESPGSLTNATEPRRQPPKLMQELCSELRRGTGISTQPDAVTWGAFHSTEEMWSQMPTLVRQFVGETSWDRVVFDLTPGTKEMTLVLAAKAPRGSHLCYVRHDQDEVTKRPKPGTEKLVVFQSGLFGHD